MLSIGTKIIDRGWPSTAKTHPVAEKMRLLEPPAQIWMKIDPYYQRQKYRPMTLVSGNIRCMWILVGFLLAGASYESGVVDDGIFSRFEWLLTVLIVTTSSVMWPLDSTLVTYYTSSIEKKPVSRLIYEIFSFKHYITSRRHHWRHVTWINYLCGSFRRTMQ